MALHVLDFGGGGDAIEDGIAVRETAELLHDIPMGNGEAGKAGYRWVSVTPLQCTKQVDAAPLDSDIFSVFQWQK